MEKLELQSNPGITNTSVPYLTELAKRSYIKEINLIDTSVSEENKEMINALLRIPHEEREIPIQSNTKSAAKCF